MPVTICRSFSKLIKDHQGLLAAQQNGRTSHQFPRGLTKPREVFVHGRLGNIMKHPWPITILDAADETAFVAGQPTAVGRGSEKPSACHVGNPPERGA